MDIIQKKFMEFLSVESLNIDLYERELILNKRFISCFAHWLNEEEAKNVFSKELMSSEKLRFYRQNFIEFYINLIKKYPTFLVKEKECIELSLLKNGKEVEEAVKRNVIYEDFQHFYIPVLNIELVGNYDLTHVIYFKDKFPECLEERAKNNNLYVLD